MYNGKLGFNPSKGEAFSDVSILAVLTSRWDIWLVWHLLIKIEYSENLARLMGFLHWTPLVISVSVTYLSHGREETLSVEEAGHPERVRPSIEAPGVELSIPVNQLSKPETKRARVPGNLQINGQND